MDLGVSKTTSLMQPNPTLTILEQVLFTASDFKSVATSTQILLQL